MDLISLIIVVAVIGFVLWLVTSFVPMDPKVKQVLVVFVLILLLLWFLQVILPEGLNFHIGRVR